MDCKKIHKILIAYIENDLSHEKSKEVSIHLQYCERCRSEYELLRQAWEGFDKKDRIPYQPFYYTRLQQKINEIDKKGTVKARKRVLQPAFFTFLLIIATGLGIMLGYSVTDTSLNAEKNNDAEERIETYASSQYVNGLELETIEKTWLTDHSD